MNIKAFCDGLVVGMESMVAERRAGIYLILNIDSGMAYIGATTDVKQRFYAHRTMLNNKKHHNERFQAEWDASEDGRFRFAPIQYEPDQTTRKLLEWEAVSQMGDKCYNWSERGPKKRERPVVATKDASFRAQKLRAKRRAEGMVELRGVWLEPELHEEFKAQIKTYIAEEMAKERNSILAEGTQGRL